MLACIYVGWLCDGLEPIPGDQSEELQRSSLRVFFATLPLADKTGGHIQIAGEDGLARSLSESQLADLLGLQTRDRREAHRVEFAHCQLVHQARGVEGLRPFRGSRPSEATILFCLFHGAVPRWFCHVASLARRSRLRVAGLRSTR